MGGAAGIIGEAIQKKEGLIFSGGSAIISKCEKCEAHADWARR